MYYWTSINRGISLSLILMRIYIYKHSTTRLFSIGTEFDGELYAFACEETHYC